MPGIDSSDVDALVYAIFVAVENFITSGVFKKYGKTDSLGVCLFYLNWDEWEIY